MPRIARGLRGGYIYHVLNRGNAKQEVFHKPQDYEAFLSLMREAKKRISIKILAYCLMPNHFHLIVMPPDTESLSKWMQWLMTSHVRRYHQHYGTSGHVWQGRFKSFLVQQTDYLLTALRYVERNPIAAHLTLSLREWPWSSFSERISNKAPDLLDGLTLELPENWEEYANRPLTEKEIQKIRQSIDRQSPYGEQKWRAEIGKLLGVESTLTPKGRPRKK